MQPPRQYVQPWAATRLISGYKPRQFEYHPHDPTLMLFGTLEGEVSIADHINNTVLASSDNFTTHQRDAILGLCWHREENTKRFYAASGGGTIRLCEYDLDSAEIRLVHQYTEFPELTSIHVNRTNELLLCSGYASHVHVYDVATGALMRKYEDIHSKHINITRFSNLTPSLFASSSFDRSAKVWDTRLRGNQPIYECRSDNPIVMLSFSPDDLFLLTSAVDNEVRQYTALDGRLNLIYDIPKLNRTDNYTRSYFVNGGDVMLTGSSEENAVRMYCAYTGDLLHSTELYPGRLHPSLYVQSLRGSPHEDFSFSTLVNYRDSTYSLEIIKMDCKKTQQGDEINVYAQRTSICNWMDDFDLKLKSGQPQCDVEVCADGFPQFPFPAHRSLLSARCRFFRDALAAAEPPAAGSLHRITIPNTTPAMLHAVLGFLYRDKLVLPEVTTLESVTDEGNGSVVAVGWEFVFDYSRRLHMMDDPYTSVTASDGVAVRREDITTARHQQQRNQEAASRSQSRAASPTSSAGEKSADCKTPSTGVSRADAASKPAAPLAFAVETVTVSPANIDRLLCAIDATMQAATLFELPRLMALLEWRAGKELEVSVATQIANLAHRRRAQQLLSQCVRFLALHLMCVQATGAVSDVEPAVSDMVLEMQEKSLAPQSRRPPLLSTAVDAKHPVIVNGQSEAALPNFPRQVPHLSGHVAVVGDGGHMFVLGGVNRHQYASLKYIPVFDPATGTWSKLRTMGQHPGTKIHHCAAGLTAVNPRHIVVFGGGDSNTTNNDVHMLDTRYLIWHAVKPYGESPPARTNFTLTLISAAEIEEPITTTAPAEGYAAIDGSAAGFEDAPEPSPGGDTDTGADAESDDGTSGLSTPQVETLRASWSCGPRRSVSPRPFTPRESAVPCAVPISPIHIPMPPPLLRTSTSSGTVTPDDGRSPARRSILTPKRLRTNDSAPPTPRSSSGSALRQANLLLYGGFSGKTNVCFGDVHILTVRQLPKSGPPAKPADASLPPSRYHGGLEGIASPLRRVDSVSAAGFPTPTDTIPFPALALPPHIEAATTVVEYSSTPAIETVSDGSDFESDGCQYQFVWSKPLVSGAQPLPRLAHTTNFLELPEAEGGNRAIIFGGAGYQFVFNDILVLRVADLSTLAWETPVVVGEPPCQRYCHSAVTIGQGGVTRSFAVFGGLDAQRSYLNDLHIGTVMGTLRGAPTIRWSTPTLQSPQPPPRCKAAMVYTPQGPLLFSGDTKPINASDYLSHPYLEDARVYRLALNDTRKKIKWTALRCTMCNPGTESLIIVPETTAHVDLLKLVDAPEYADVTFKLDNTAGYAFEPMTEEEEVPLDSSTPVTADTLLGHAWLLRSRSSRFDALLSSGMLEASSKQIPVLGIPKRVFRLLLEFLYTDSVDPRIAPEMAHDVLVASMLYSLPRLARLAEGRLIRFIDEDNVLSLLKFADMHGTELLGVAARAFILRQYGVIKSMPEFEMLPPSLQESVEVLWKESVYSHGLSGSALVNPEERLKAEPVDTRDEDDGIEEVHLDDADFSDFSGSNVDSGDDFD